MRHVIVPARAMILCRGKMLVEELIPGDAVRGFDLRNGRVAMVTIQAIIPVDPVQKVLVPLTRYKMMPMAKETVGLTRNKIERTIVGSENAMGFCQERMQLVVQELGCPIESEGTVEAVELQWEWPEYIWFEGILVGTEL